MRELEYFHAMKMLPGAWPIIRVDGKGFSKFTESNFKKPFDERFHQLMVQTAEKLLVELGGVYAYTESDEISLLLPREWNLYDREVEKTVSISAGIASSTFTLASGQAVVFDSRIWLGASEDLVMDYFRWRQADAHRCALNGWTYWTLRNQGQDVAKATSALFEKTVAEKNELLFTHGINFNDLPLWQRRGTGLYWEDYEKPGYDPIRQIEVAAQRRRIKIDRELPMKDEYSLFLKSNVMNT
ncbi:MAG: tRNA(His) guanylyltransferase Thg1 family protein [Gemmataceae bacterium]